jgi:hypothetical protein
MKLDEYFLINYDKTTKIINAELPIRVKANSNHPVYDKTGTVVSILGNKYTMQWENGQKSIFDIAGDVAMNYDVDPGV